MSSEEEKHEPRFPFVLVDVDEAAAEEAGVLLFDLGARGVEERDATTLVRGAPGKRTLVASFLSYEDAEAARVQLDREWNARIEEIVGDAWRDAWKVHFRPFLLCPGVIVRPPWELYEGPVVSHVLELEPGRAFGTGLHETTSLVAEALAAHVEVYRGRAILDVGCGSGILALVAVLLGAAHATAIDTDPDVIDVVRENAKRNALTSRVEASATPLDAIAQTYDGVVANIEADVLVHLADALSLRVKPGGLLVLSGVLVPQMKRVLEAYPRFHLRASPQKGEWVALVLRCPG